MFVEGSSGVFGAQDEKERGHCADRRRCEENKKRNVGGRSSTNGWAFRGRCSSSFSDRFDLGYFSLSGRCRVEQWALASASGPRRSSRNGWVVSPVLCAAPIRRIRAWRRGYSTSGMLASSVRLTSLRPGRKRLLLRGMRHGDETHTGVRDSATVPPAYVLTWENVSR